LWILLPVLKEDKFVCYYDLIVVFIVTEGFNLGILNKEKSVLFFFYEFIV